MKVRRLSWAGIEIETVQQKIIVDAMDTTTTFEPVMGQPAWQLMTVPSFDGRLPVDALVTHRHRDHYDPEALKRALGPEGRVFCPIEMVPEIESDGLKARGVAVWETVQLGNDPSLAVTAVPSLDWMGDAQIAWVVDDGTHRIFHGGDTLWHGSWWAIAKKLERFDLVFLPINGVVVQVPGVAPSNLPGVMTPDQAAVAARLLNADLFCPIHYGQFSNLEIYREHPDVVDAVRVAAQREGVALRVAKDGEVLLGK